MIQQVKSLLSTPRLTNLFKKGLRSNLRFLPLLCLLSVATLGKASANSTLVFPGDTSISATICANETYPFDGQLLDSAGVYEAVFIASDGSDSIVRLELIVLPLLSETVNASICAGDIYEFFGLSLTVAGEYDAVLPGSNGCDSTVTLVLTLLPNALTGLSVGICTGSEYLFQGDTLTQSGTYSAILPAANGCDSLIRLSLSVVDFFDVQQESVICFGETYEFSGVVLDSSGVYIDSLIAIGGCDSIVTLTLTVLPKLIGEIDVAICEGASYIFHGDTLMSDGTYEFLTTGSYGCDSLVVLHLTTALFFETFLEATICNGETYILGTQELTTEGNYEELLAAIGGCDSTLLLKLYVLPTSSGVDSATICDGESFIYHGDTLQNPGDYVFVLDAYNGCDSVVTFTLTVLEVPNTVFEAVVCFGETFFFYGQNLGESGVYEELFDAANGCDSIISLILTVLPELTTTLEISMCAGETYDFNGEILEESGTYTQVLVSEFDCDSTVIVMLTVYPKQITVFEALICAGATYEFGDSPQEPFVKSRDRLACDGD